ncbi:MAG: AbrB/MazE/SpoVT family DNA-binding domain-containing protein [Acidobacteria bacterium]|nr:AbrB/MazE/SpoVT family DNA-binding domain-containing protein [Acidobacteriota bacterium]
MTRKIVQTGSSLAVTLPRDVVEQFKLKKGDAVEVSVHPRTGAIIVRTGVRYLEGGKVTKRFTKASRRALAKYDEAFRELAK